MDAIDLLKQDHRNVDKLFSEFMAVNADITDEDLVDQDDLFQRIESELLTHGEAEERVFYPALRSEAPEQVEEAMKEHSEVKTMLAELLNMDFDEEEFEMRFIRLMETVKNHVQEEEAADGLLQIARQKLDRKTLLRLAREIELVKREVQDELAA